MMTTSNPTWNANTPWDSTNQSQQQTSQWNQSYNSAMHPPPPSVSSQYNQFGFGSNSWSNPQRSSLPSPNMNHQFLGINGSSTSGNFTRF